MFDKEDFPASKTARTSEPDLLDIRSANSVEDLTRELAEHQERLLALKRQQDEVESRKRELEELSQRRSELTSGQKSIREKLTRAITLLERAEYDAQREIETIRNTRQSFKEHLGDVEEINTKDWEPNEVDEQLTRALSVIDHAQTSYSQSKVKLESISGRLGDKEGIDDDDDESDANYDSPSFFELIRRGLAFSLPLMILLAAIAFLILTRS
jgi:predicted  nucleic acid-binding Zn-ribbon protein